MPKKTKNKKSISSAIVNVSATFNNTIITISDENGDVVSWSSAGHLGFKGARKATPYAAQKAMEDALGKISENNIEKFKINISGIGPGRDSAIRILQGKKCNIVEIKDITPIPHNGCRPKKPRKV